MDARFDRIAPVFATLDLKRSLETYERLGSETEMFGGPADPFYGFIRRGPVEIQMRTFR